MKSKLLLSLSFVGFLLSACNGRQSVHTDLKTGAYTRGDGLGCNDVDISIRDKVESRNSFFYGEKVNLVFNKVEGLKKINGLTYPKLAMYVVKNGKDTVLSNDDLLPEMKEGTKLFPLKLTSHFVAALPYKNGEKYKVLVRISDLKGEGTLNYELPFTIKESDNIVVNKAGVDYSSAYLWDDTEKFPVTGNKVDQDHKYILILEGVEGLEIKEGNVFPKISVVLRDKSARQMLNNPNIIQHLERSGTNAEEFTAGQVPITVSFTKGEIENPCMLTVQIEDQFSMNKMRINTKLVIQ